MSSRPLTVLVVDDDADTVATYQDLFELCGYDTRIALSADGALALLDGWEPDVAILDLSMPRADGFVLARQLRVGGGPARSGGRHRPVVGRVPAAGAGRRLRPL